MKYRFTSILVTYKIEPVCVLQFTTGVDKPCLILIVISHFMRPSCRYNKSYTYPDSRGQIAIVLYPEPSFPANRSRSTLEHGRVVQPVPRASTMDSRAVPGLSLPDLVRMTQGHQTLLVHKDQLVL